MTEKTMWLPRTEFHQFLSQAKSCPLNVRCAMMEGSRVIGTLCPSVTDGQIGEKHRDVGQWSNLWSCSLFGSCKLTRPPLGRDGVKGRQPRHLLRFWKSPDSPSLLSPDNRRSNIAKKRRGSEEADTKRWSFVPVSLFWLCLLYRCVFSFFWPEPLPDFFPPRQMQWEKDGSIFPKPLKFWIVGIRAVCTQEKHAHKLKSLNEWPGYEPVQSACCGGCK